MAREGKLLGKQVEYPTEYSPGILVGVPRYLNRETYDIYHPEELFCGSDSWHAYEASFITTQGIPVNGVVKLVYVAYSNYIVESKSLKLYLGSFNMTPLGATPEEGIKLFVKTIESDLSKLVHAEVKAHFFTERPTCQPFDFEEYKILEHSEEINSHIFSIYQEFPPYLTQDIVRQPGEIKVCSHLLKSNCKITAQPDWGSIYIHLKSDQLPSELSLLKYIVSLRNENHFHEEICEMVFKRLWDNFSPEILAISCLYTRRGGIDICPSRANKEEYLPLYLPQAEVLTERLFRQ